MNITKDYLRKIIKEELNEIGYYGLGSEPQGAERYRKKIKGFEELLDSVDSLDPSSRALEDAVKLSVAEVLSNIKDEKTKEGVELMVSELLGMKYLPQT